jgi:hypothetical protein
MAILSGLPAKETIIQHSNIGTDDDGDGTISKKDLEKFRKKIREDTAREKNKGSALETGRKAFNGVRKGLHDVAESLNTPRTKRRPIIAQLPDLPKAGISHTMNFTPLIHPKLRTRDITGRRIK